MSTQHRYLKIFIFSLFVAGLCGLNLSPSFSQDEGVALVNEASGEISSIDQEKSTIIIKQLADEEAEIYEDLVIYVDNMTTIEKNYETAELKDLKTGDKVELEYATNDEGKNVATYILVKTKK